MIARTIIHAYMCARRGRLNKSKLCRCCCCPHMLSSTHTYDKQTHTARPTAKGKVCLCLTCTIAWCVCVCVGRPRPWKGHTKDAWRPICAHLRIYMHLVVVVVFVLIARASRYSTRNASSELIFTQHRFGRRKLCVFVFVCSRIEINKNWKHRPNTHS